MTGGAGDLAGKGILPDLKSIATGGLPLGLGPAIIAGPLGGATGAPGTLGGGGGRTTMGAAFGGCAGVGGLAAGAAGLL